MRPVIREQEFADRWKKVQALMEEQKVDLVAAYADDRYVYGQAYSRWLVDYEPQFEAAFVLVPAVGEPCIITGAESVEFALLSSKCKNVKAIWEFLHPDEEYPYCEVTSLESVIRELEERSERKITNVGIAGKSAVPYDLYKTLIGRFGEEHLIDVDSPMSMLRAVKTDNEIEVIRYAYQIAEAGMQKVYESIREGSTEREIAAEAEYVMRKMGAEGMGIAMMINSGRENTSPILSRTTFRKIEKGDLVVATIAPRYEGYHGAIGRPFVLGTPDDDVKRYIELVMYAQEETRKMLRPGVTAREMDAVSRKYIEEAGMGSHFAYSGIHSTGTIEFEPPILSSKLDLTVQKNMVFSIDIPMFLNDWGGMRLENGYLVTEDGCEALCSCDVHYRKESL